MDSARSTLHIYKNLEGLPRSYTSAASLHCHTYHSKEFLTFIPYYAARIPIISRLFQSEMERYQSANGKAIDFGSAYWTSPVSPRQVLELETLQIEKELGLPALVSITDHDDIEAGLQLQLFNSSNRIPISLEWTVPYQKIVFHLGIHNLPAEYATWIVGEMVKFTRNPNSSPNLTELLEQLNQYPGTLIVFNHPLWDMEHMGSQEHARQLNEFLGEYGHWIHALEINGYRSWRENCSVMRLAEEFGYPVVTGGDRHGCQANTLLNLTRSNSFDEFVAEIREDCHSEVLLMPAYSESRIARMLEVIADVLRNYPIHSLGQTKWTDRIFIDLDGNGVSPLSKYFRRGGPLWLRASLSLLRFLGSRHLQPALRFALANEKTAGERMGYES
ncbi:MAG: hypothetical protein L0220_20540 [Acidobacteria bacterium]|nr:hypothetical protein [Acidobacteriota bacterium]